MPPPSLAAMGLSVAMAMGFTACTEARACRNVQPGLSLSGEKRFGAFIERLRVSESRNFPFHKREKPEAQERGGQGVEGTGWVGEGRCGETTGKEDAGWLCLGIKPLGVI